MANLPPVYPHLTADQILQRITTAESDYLKKRWLAIALMSGLRDAAEERELIRKHPGAKLRLSARRVADALGYSSQWVRKLVHAYNKKGIAAIEKKRRKRRNAGRQGVLLKSEQRKLAKYFEEDADKRSIADICDFVSYTLGVQISASTACRYRQRFKKGAFPRPLKPKKGEDSPARTPLKKADESSPTSSKTPQQNPEPPPMPKKMGMFASLMDEEP